MWQRQILTDNVSDEQWGREWETLGQGEDHQREVGGDLPNLHLWLPALGLPGMRLREGRQETRAVREGGRHQEEIQGRLGGRLRVRAEERLWRQSEDLWLRPAQRLVGERSRDHSDFQKKTTGIQYEVMRFKKFIKLWTLRRRDCSQSPGGPMRLRTW